MTDTSFSHLVVVGSSAGGIEALCKLVSTLPEDFSAPIVIAQHLDPNRISHLEEILSRRSTLPVRTVTDHEPLSAGVVFVVPADRHVNITDSEIELSTGSDGRPKPSVDLLLSSAAEVYGEHLVAVILTGTGSDGAEGARVVRRMGGTILIQDPATAEFSSMPLSLAPNTVDIVAGLDRMGAILNNLTDTEVAEKRGQENEEQALEQLLEQLRERYGMDFRSYKTSTIRRRLQRRIAATNTENIEAYARYLDEHPEEYRHLISSFLIKVTEFFRDPEVFTYLKEEILPGLVNEAQEEHRQLRIWSAGCATGEEAYSLAILVSEILDDEAGLFNVRIFATDMDEEAVDFARHGVYPASALSNLSEEQVRRYFIKENGQYQITKSVRSLIVFGEHDLAQRSPFPRIDLVMSRNVLIYFTPELQLRALQVFAYSLRDGGYLVLGKAETTSPLGELFAQEHSQHKIYRRHGERFLMPPTTPVNPAPALRRSQRIRSVANLQAPTESEHELRQARTAGESLLSRLPIGVVVVDRRYHIQAINPTARHLLSIRGAAIGEDLLHMMRGEVPYAEARLAIDAAFRDGESTSTGEFIVEEITTGEPRYLELLCHPERTEDKRGPVETVMIVVNEVTDPARSRRELEKQLEKAEAEAAQQETQNERLIETNHLLEEANRELTRINEELHTAYEEALVSTEEAQAATEEVETLNEELQATNEELETVNEELQATIEELNTTNDDLQARSVELQELARTSEEERRASDARTEELATQLRDEKSRLEAILSSMSGMVLAVNTEGEMLFSSDGYKEAFGEESGTVGALLDGFTLLDENGEELSSEATPPARAARGESFVMRFAIDEEGRARRHFEAEGRPVEGEEEEIVGGVIVIREITEDQQH